MLLFYTHRYNGIIIHRYVAYLNNYYLKKIIMTVMTIGKYLENSEMKLINNFNKSM